MGRFDNYDMNVPEGYEERMADVEKSMSNFDPAEALELNFMWDGEYYFRVLPPLDLTRDWIVPRGYHWGVFPTGDEKKPRSKDGCPHMTYGEDCPICSAIKKVTGEKRGDWKEFNGQDKIGVTKEYLLRILLIRVKNLKKGKKSAPPKWKEGDLPDIKVGVFKQSAADAIIELASPTNDDYGWGKITHPKDGIVLKLTHDSEKEPAKQYVVGPVMELYPIPDRFLEDEVVDHWPNLQSLLPELNTKELYAKIEKHQLDLDPRIANAVLAIEAEYGEQKQLPSGENEGEEQKEEKPKKGKDMAALKAELAKRKNK